MCIFPSFRLLNEYSTCVKTYSSRRPKERHKFMIISQYDRAQRSLTLGLRCARIDISLTRVFFSDGDLSLFSDGDLSLFHTAT